MTTDVVVVGGGIFGVGAALELRRRGAVVTLLDPGPIPHPDAASTDITKLVRLDYGADVFYTELMEEALGLWRAWNAGWEAPLFHETGILVLSSIPMSKDGFEGASFETVRARGHEVDRLDADAIASRFPRFRPGHYVDGYWNPQGGFAESGRVVSALLDEAIRNGVRVRPSARVRPLEGNGRVEGVELESGERLAAGTVVVACGAFTPKVVPELADRLTPVGQPVLHFAPDDLSRFAPPRFVPWAADIGRTGWYGFSAHANVVKVANHGTGRVVDPAAVRLVDDGAEAKFRAFFRDAIPELVAAPRVFSRLCLYCDSFDGDFFIDRHPTREGLVVAAGGSGHAFKFGPLLGRFIADAVDGKSGARREMERARFGWRERGAVRFEDARCTDARGEMS